jgi:hypothetical protein
VVTEILDRHGIKDEPFPGPPPKKGQRRAKVQDPKPKRPTENVPDRGPWPGYADGLSVKARFSKEGRDIRAAENQRRRSLDMDERLEEDRKTATGTLKGDVVEPWKDWALDKLSGAS